jgi:hypothetical protein
MLLYFFLLTICLFIVVSIVANITARQYAKEVSTRIKSMELLYEAFLKRKLSADFDPNDIRYEPEVLAKDAMQQLNPSLDGLLNYINKAYLSKVRIRYHSTYFPNILTLCEEAFSSRAKSPEKRLGVVDTERFRMALYDALWADLNHRITKREDENNKLEV